MEPQWTYPRLTRAEILADGILHVLGVGFAIAGTAFLLVYAADQATPGVRVGLSVYGAALIVSFIASACYHLTPWEHLRLHLRRIDQAAIYLKIAGTYTPLVVFIGSAFAYGVLAVVWALASFGVAAKLFFGTRHGKLMPLIYLGMGWLSLSLIWSLFPLLPPAACALIIAGGVTYSVGVALFYWGGLRFNTAIWHGHVLAASACFFVAIAMGAVAPLS